MIQHYVIKFVSDIITITCVSGAFSRIDLNYWPWACVNIEAYEKKV
jgi:hypothetical protein